MKVSLEKVELLCKERNIRIGEMLREAGVSRNAFYTLARKDYVIPRSLVRIADHLGVPSSSILIRTFSLRERMKSLIAEVDRISKQHREVDRDNIRHTLLLLDEKPIERLRRALQRGRSINIR
jgi:ACT domain-containing protein